MGADLASSVAACRSRFPIFERLTYLNSCSQGALSDAVRSAYADYLTDWDDKGAPWAYWVERAETVRAAFADLVGGAPDDVAVTTSLSAGVSALASTFELDGAPARRRHRLRVPHGRPDLACAGAAGRRGGARPSRRRSRSRWSASRRRSTSERLSSRSPRSVTGTARAFLSRRSWSSRTPAARSCCSMPTRRSAPIRSTSASSASISSAQACSSTCSPRPVSASSGAGPGSRRRCFPPRPAGSPTRTSSRWTSPTTRRRRRPGASSRGRRRSRPSTPASPASSLIQEIGIAETREHVTGLNERLIAGIDELGGIVVTPRAPERRGALVCIRSTDAPALVSALEADGIVTSERDGNLRVSPHAYNVAEDIDTLLSALARHRDLLARA